VISVLSRRYPLVEVVLSPTLVQGDSAPPEIVAAIEALNRCADVDTIIVTRGGGSLEELWAFNDERVARAVAASRFPVICGVGHETDFSLAGFAADVRAPTPSAAAEVAVPDRAELQARIGELAAAQMALFRGAVHERRWRLTELTQALRHVSPLARLVQMRQRVDDVSARGESALRHGLILRRERLAGLVGQLEGISPLRTLERGYAIVRHQESGGIVRAAAQVVPGDALDVRVAEGEFEAQVV
jgi:exodeoxyribonuclease VII large subunit